MPWYRHLLWPFAIVYGMAIVVRNLLFDLGVLPSRKFEVPVLCVGNLETGGTGKSPLVNYIVEVLLENGNNVAVISRGYGRRTSGFRTVKTEGKATEVGDEPLQLKRRHPKATVVVCENRVKGIEKLLQLDPKPDIVIMDDGFQHRWVKPSFSILVTSVYRPFINNWLLPVGTLREPVFAASRSDVTVMTGASEKMNSAEANAKGVYLAQTLTGDEIQISGEKSELEVGDAVVTFCGIANAYRFEDVVKRKFDVLEHLGFADHHNYTASDLQLLRKKIDSFGAAAKALITTEKDAVRLMDTPLLDELGEIPVFYLPIDIEFLFDKAAEFDKMILQHGKHA